MRRTDIPPQPALRVAIVGAESTGKTTLARALAPQLAQLSGLRVAWVPEVLREWCDEAGRTPRVDEQAAIAHAQQQRIEAAAARHDVVVCDTTPLMTAVYSAYLFADTTLRRQAVELHRRNALTLLMALDLPWVADGLQRDGPQVREPVDTLLRHWLLDHGLPYSLVAGAGPARLQCALDAVAPLLRPRSLPGSGFLTRLAARNAEPAARHWRCECCDDAGCEQRLLHGR